MILFVFRNVKVFERGGSSWSQPIAVGSSQRPGKKSTCRRPPAISRCWLLSLNRLMRKLRARTNAVSYLVSKAAGRASYTADPCTTILHPCGNSSDTSRRRPEHRLRDLPLKVPSHFPRRRRSRPTGPASIPLSGPLCNSAGHHREYWKSSAIGLSPPLL